MSQPPAYTPVGAGMPDILDAFYGFLSTYLVHYVPAENIIRGWENRYALPSGTNDYIIYTLSGSSRVGTNALSEVSADGTMTFSTLFEGTVQIDFCSDTEASRLWAAYCDSLLRSPVGPAFFAPYGFSSTYTDNPVSVEYADGSDQYVKRTTLTVHVCYTLTSTVALEYAERVWLSRLENVDAHHKP